MLNPLDTEAKFGDDPLYEPPAMKFKLAIISAVNLTFGRKKCKYALCNLKTRICF